MAKKCPQCRRMNEDEMFVCSYCGSLLDARQHLIQQLDQREKHATARPTQQQRRQDDDEDFQPIRRPVKKQSKAPVVLALIAVVAIVVIVALALK